VIRREIALLLGALGGFAAPGALASQSRTQVVMLGTGTPNADPDRSGPAVAIVAGPNAYLVDAGPGVVRRAAAAHRQGVEALAVAGLRRVFITHLHSDHTLGLPDLIFSPWVLEREAPLEVYGPPGIRAMTDHLAAAFRDDVQVRLDGLEPANRTGYHVVATEVAPGEVYRDEHVTVRAFAVSHGSWEYAYGYRFETSDQTIVVSGDTRPSESVVAACRGCDLLVHEVYSQAGYARRPPEWQRYHAAFHTSTAELAELAARAKPRLLVLYHQLYWGTTDAELLAEVGRGYAGRVVSARDLDVF
jgi:ribonuclease BN (tRNA processing enzyme)